MNTLLAAYEIGGTWRHLGAYNNTAQAKAAAIEWAKNGSVDQTDDGVCRFRIFTSDQDQEDFFVEYETGESW